LGPLYIVQNATESVAGRVSKNTYVAFSFVQTEPLVSTCALGPNTLSVRSRNVLFLYRIASLLALKRMHILPL